MDNDFEIYKNKKFSDLCKDIVVNSEKNSDQLDILVSELRTMIKTPNDALLIVPMIKEYFDVRIKNDEQLVKLAAVVQRIMTKNVVNPDGSSNFSLTDEEKKLLMQEIQDIDDSLKTSTVKLTTIKK